MLLRSKAESLKIDQGVKWSRKLSAQTPEEAKAFSEIQGKFVNPPRCAAEAKEHAVIDVSTLFLRKLEDSVVGKALKALKGKIS